MSIGRSGAAVLLLWAIVEFGTPAPTLYGREPASGTCLTGPALAAGRLKRCERELQRYLDAREDNAAAWFELGFVRCLIAGQRLARWQYAHGRCRTVISFPVTSQIDVDSHPDPAMVRYRDLRAASERFAVDLRRAESAFSRCSRAEFKCTMDLAEV